MNITVIGTGYVGLVSGTCLAEVGNHVLCVDIDQSKIDRLNNGEIPIYEPGLEALVKKNVQEGRLSFSSSIEDGVDYGKILFIAVHRGLTNRFGKKLLILGKISFGGILLQINTAGSRMREKIICLEHPGVDQRQGKPVYQRHPEFIQQIRCQCCVAVTRLMVKSKIRIKSQPVQQR